MGSLKNINKQENGVELEKMVKEIEKIEADYVKKMLNLINNFDEIKQAALEFTSKKWMIEELKGQEEDIEEIKRLTVKTLEMLKNIAKLEMAKLYEGNPVETLIKFGSKPVQILSGREEIELFAKETKEKLNQLLKERKRIDKEFEKIYEKKKDLATEKEKDKIKGQFDEVRESIKKIENTHTQFIDVVIESITNEKRIRENKKEKEEMKKEIEKTKKEIIKIMNSIEKVSIFNFVDKKEKEQVVEQLRKMREIMIQGMENFEEEETIEIELGRENLIKKAEEVTKKIIKVVELQKNIIFKNEEINFLQQATEEEKEDFRFENAMLEKKCEEIKSLVEK